jgi:hypothetical protein
MKMLNWKRSRRYGAAVALAVSLGACGDKPTQPCPAGTTGSPPNCRPIEVPVQCTQTVVSSDAGTAKSRTLYHSDFSVPDTGRLDITVDYTNASSMVGVYLTPANTCTLDEFNARTCNFLVRAEPPGPKPRKMSVNLAAGNYRWLVGIFSESDESVSQQFVLSKGNCAAHTGAPPEMSARPAGESLEATQAQPR